MFTPLRLPPSTRVPGLLLASGAVFLLAVACNRPASALPPEDVMQKAALAAQLLDSARYHAEGNFRVEQEGLGSLEANAVIEGILGEKGDQVQFTMDLQGTVQPPEGVRSSLRGSLEIMALGEQEVYMNLKQLSIDPPTDLLHPDMVERFVGQWWLLPAESSQAAPAVAADPRLLRMQSEVVKVVNDLGMGNVDGHSVYRYAVTLDQEKLVDYYRRLAQESGEEFNEAEVRATLQSMHADGELWVDAESFHVHYVSWTIEPFTMQPGTVLSGSFRATLRDHNAAPALAPPLSAKPFDVGQLWVPEPTDEIDGTFPSDLEEEILQEILNTNSNAIAP